MKEVEMRLDLRKFAGEMEMTVAIAGCMATGLSGMSGFPLLHTILPPW